MIRLQAKQLTKTYRRGDSPAVNQVSFELAEGRLLSLVGESGSGKTTILRLLAGLETPDTGEVLLDGQVISSPTRIIEPERRGIGLVFQNHALFPHLTVAKNIAFGISPCLRNNAPPSSHPCWNSSASVDSKTATLTNSPAANASASP